MLDETLEHLPAIRQGSDVREFRRQHSFLVPGEQGGQRLWDKGMTARQISSQFKANHCPIFPERLMETELGNLTTGEANSQETPLPGQGRPGRIKEIPSNCIEDEICSPS